MNKKDKVRRTKAENESKPSSVGAILKGLLTALGISLTVFLIIAAVMTFAGGLEDSSVLIAVYVTGLAAVLAGSLETAFLLKERGLINGIIVAAAYVLVMIITGYIILPDFALGMKSLVTLAAAALGGAVGGIMGVNLKR